MSKQFQNLQTKVQKKVDTMISYAEKKWDIEMDLVYINYDLTSKRALGTCLTEVKHGEVISYISLNPELLKEYKNLYIEDIVTHEVAHAIVGHIYPNKRNGYKRVMPHGKEFKAVCSHFNIDGKATTKLFSDSKHLQSTRKKSRTFTYACGCAEHQLTSIRHNKILNGTSYSCKSCKQKLKTLQ